MLPAEEKGNVMNKETMVWGTERRETKAKGVQAQEKAKRKERMTRHMVL